MVSERKQAHAPANKRGRIGATSLMLNVQRSTGKLGGFINASRAHLHGATETGEFPEKIRLSFPETPILSVPGTPG